MCGDSPDARSQTNSIDPRLYQMQQQQAKNATDFGNNIQGYEQQQQNSASDSSRQNLAQALAGTTANSNARGMLYGSYNAGQQANDTARAAANLNATDANINTNAQNQLSNMQSQAINSGLLLNQSQQSEENAAYQTALAQKQSDNAMFGNLIKGGATVAGAAMGGPAGAAAGYSAGSMVAGR